MKLAPRRGARLSATVVLAAALSVPGHAPADDAGSNDRRSHVVARLESASITVGELESAIAAMPPFQRATFGSSPAEVRRRFLSEVVVRDALLARAADQRRLAELPPAAYQIERARSAATVRAIRTRIGPAAAIPMVDVERYYDENRARYDTPERYLIWRILCKTREEAESVLDSTKRDPTPLNFATLAREHSVDKATYLRSGNLGFLTADGRSSEPGLRVDSAVVRAAQSVPDGALVAAPISEGEYFSVVWRRGTIQATKRTPAELSAQIRDAIWKARVKEETDKLVAGLRAAKVRDLDASILKTIDIPVDDGGASLKTASP
jgi:peptidyl-prolyl cis-trans isomerase C